MPAMKQVTGIFATLLIGSGAMLGCGGSTATNAVVAKYSFGSHAALA